MLNCKGEGIMRNRNRGCRCNSNMGTNQSNCSPILEMADDYCECEMNGCNYSDTDAADVLQDYGCDYPMDELDDAIGYDCSDEEADYYPYDNCGCMDEEADEEDTESESTRMNCHCRCYCQEDEEDEEDTRSAYTRGYKKGYKKGYKEGTQAGYKDGYEQGCKDGCKAGYEKAKNQLAEYIKNKKIYCCRCR